MRLLAKIKVVMLALVGKTSITRGYFMARLSIADQLFIDEKIDAIKAVTGKRLPKDSLLDLIKAYSPNLEIKEYNFGPDSPFIRGAIKYKTNPAILLNEKNPSEGGRNFTLAHEFAHYVLHENEEMFRLDLVDYANNTEETKKETEANYFAASLLMPQAEFEEMLKLTDDKEKIAAYFGVSVPAVEVRKKWLIQNKKK